MLTNGSMSCRQEARDSREVFNVQSIRILTVCKRFLTLPI
jgi:hypothetical protein